MKMNKTFAPFLLGVTAFALSLAGAAHAGGLDAATAAKIAQFDKGPATIDVSSYPQGIQKNYKVFSRKCSQCHKLSRPINCDFALPDEWARYVKRMMFKPGSNISRSEAKKIYDFLVYDSSVRKKALLDQKLAALTAGQKATEVAKIQKVHEEYGTKYASK